LQLTTLEKTVAALAVLLLVPCWLAAMGVLAYITSGDPQGLVAVFRIAAYAIVLWLPLLGYVLNNKHGMSGSLRGLALAPAIALAVITLVASLLWWR
jgi:hypothetical protein